MLNTDLMKYVLMVLLLLSGYFFLLHFVSKRTANRKSLPLLALVMLVIYGAVAVPLMIILNEMGDTSFVLLTLLILLATAVLLLSLFNLLRNFQRINKPVFILFVLYMMMVAYITLFSRSEGHSKAILLRFDSIRAAIGQHSLEPLHHVFLNAIMFVPIGFLLPMMDPDNLDHFMYIGPLGLMLTTLIEATQMFLQIGQCDLEDIVANTLGALIGLIIFKILKPWIVKRDEEEDEEEE